MVLRCGKNCDGYADECNPGAVFQSHHSEHLLYRILGEQRNKGGGIMTSAYVITLAFTINT